jgi:hypothetical protein
VPTQVEPPELAQLIDYAERSRVGDWSLRAALCRYASPEPGRVRDILTLVRRIEAALHSHLKSIEKDGPAVWEALQSGDGSDSTDPLVLGLLQAMTELDRLGEDLASWAVDRKGERPDAAVDAAIADVGRRLDELGVPHEERVRPPGTGGGRGV